MLFSYSDCSCFYFYVGLSHKVAVGLSSKHQGKMMRQFHTIVDEALDLVGAESSISSSKISPAPKQVLVSNVCNHSWKSLHYDCIVAFD